MADDDLVTQKKQIFHNSVLSILGVAITVGGIAHEKKARSGRAAAMRRGQEHQICACYLKKRTNGDIIMPVLRAQIEHFLNQHVLYVITSAYLQGM